MKDFLHKCIKEEENMISECESMIERAKLRILSYLDGLEVLRKESETAQDDIEKS